MCLVAILIDFSSAACLHPKCNTCGNGRCEKGENSCLCPQDCSGCCPDGICHPEHGETHKNCPSDCGTKLRVYVIDALTGQPLNMSNVTCYSKASVLGTENTGAGNSYAWEPVEAGKWACRAERMGYWPNSAAENLTNPSCFQETEIIVPLTPRKICIHGDVINAWTNESIPNATVVCGTSGTTLPTRMTDINGHFFYDFAPLGNITCNASRTGFESSARTLPYDWDDCNPQRHHRIYLRPAAGIVSVNVVLNFSCPEDDYVRKNATIRNTNIVCQDSHGNRFSASGMTTARGRLYPGIVNCTATNVNRYSATEWGFLTPTGNLTLNIFLRLFFGNLAGQVLDGYRNRPIPNVEIDCASPYHYGSAVTGLDGNYMIPYLLNGTFMCMAMAQGYQDGWLNVIVNENRTATLNFVLLPIQSSISGKIFSYPYDAIQNATVECFLSNGHDEIQSTKKVSISSGQYFVGDLYGYGSLGCYFAKPGYQTVGRFYNIRSGTVINCDIPLVLSRDTLP